MMRVRATSVLTATLVAVVIGTSVVPASGHVAAVDSGSVESARVDAVARAENSTAQPTRALLRVDGGTAVATKVGKHKYVLRMPRDVSIRWLGEVGNGPSQFGRFTPKHLTTGWARLGHRPGIGVGSAILWKSPGSGRTEFTGARVSDPRINRDGLLVFTARLAEGDLPGLLPEFSLNVTPGEPGSRAYPLAWPISQVSANDFGFKVTATGDNAGQVEFQYYEVRTATWKRCSNTTPSNANPIKFDAKTGTRTGIPTMNCNGTRIQADQEYSQIFLNPSDPNNAGSSSEVVVCMNLQLDGKGPYAPFCWGNFTWKAGGTNPEPAIP